MKELQAWLDRRARQDQRIPCLDDVFLSGRFREYARYRLRLFFLRWLAASVVHIVRVLLLSAAFSRETFLQLLLAEAAVGFASSFWWGALESMRERIRNLHRQGRAFEVPREVERWLTAASVLAAAVLTAGAAWLALRRGPFGPFELYAVVLFARLALQFVTRTFHSGAYAVRRVYRPGWAVVAVELVSFGVVVLVWPIAGAWALPIGTLAAALAGAAITVHYTRRSYRFLGVSPRWAVLGALRQRWKIAWIEVLGAGLSFAVMKLDSVLVFGLFESGDVPLGEVQLFLLLFVMGPTIQAGFDWAQLFYFDLKRLHVAPLAPLLEQYRAHVTRLAWLVGAMFWVLGSLTGTVVYLRSLGALYGLLCPFFIARSLVASAQIQAFSARRYGVLLGTASLWLAGFALATQITGESGKLAAVTLATAAVYFALARMAQPAAPDQETCVGVVEWLRLLSAVATPVRIRSATLRPLCRRKGEPRAAFRALRWSQRQFARTLATRLKRSGAVTIVPPDRVVWFERVGARIRPETVAALSGGVAQSVRDTGAHPTGRSAIVAAWREHGLEAAFGPASLQGAQPLSLGDLERRFAQLFPDGWVFTPGTAATEAATVPARWRRRIIRAASRFLAELNPARDGSPLDVTALCVAGRLRRIFVAPRDGRLTPRRRWRAAIRQANVLAALDASAE